MKFLEQLEAVTYDYVALSKAVVEMIKLEARLAKLSLSPLLLSFALLIVVCMTIWFTFIALAAYVFTYVSGSLLIALAGILVMNFVLLAGLLVYFRFNLRQMTFEKTRHYFSPKKETAHDDLKKTSTD